MIVLFGATGDLARRKLLPGLFHLAACCPRTTGSSDRRPRGAALTDEEFRGYARRAIQEFGLGTPEGTPWQAFEDALSFGAADPRTRGRCWTPSGGPNGRWGARRAGSATSRCRRTPSSR